MVTNGSFVVHLTSSGDSEVDHYQTAVRSCSAVQGVHEVDQYQPMTMFLALREVPVLGVQVGLVGLHRWVPEDLLEHLQGHSGIGELNCAGVAGEHRHHEGCDESVPFGGVSAIGCSEHSTSRATHERVCELLVVGEGTEHRFERVQDGNVVGATAFGLFDDQAETIKPRCIRA